MLFSNPNKERGRNYEDLSVVTQYFSYVQENIETYCDSIRKQTQSTFTPLINTIPQLYELGLESWIMVGKTLSIKDSLGRNLVRSWGTY